MAIGLVRFRAGAFGANVHLEIYRFVTSDRLVGRMKPAEFVQIRAIGQAVQLPSQL
jgi:hypothetical protein